MEWGRIITPVRLYCCPGLYYREFSLHTVPETNNLLTGQEVTESFQQQHNRDRNKNAFPRLITWQHTHGAYTNKLKLHSANRSSLSGLTTLIQRSKVKILCCNTCVVIHAWQLQLVAIV